MCFSVSKPGTHPPLQLHFFVVDLKMEMMVVQFALDLQRLPGVLMSHCLVQPLPQLPVAAVIEK